MTRGVFSTAARLLLRVIPGALLVLLIAGCSARKLRDACEAIAPGELMVDVAARLEAAGGRYVGKLGREYHWTRSKGFFKTANCLVEDDKPPATGAPDPSKRPPPDARVISARYIEGDDLL